MKKSFAMIGLALFFFSTKVLAYQAEVQDIPSDKYFEITLNEINNAKSSIEVVMYLVSIFPSQPDSQVNQLVNALIKAKERGVQVKVILDHNMDFTESTGATSQNKNQAAYEILKQNGISVFFDESQTYTHAKTVVIDNETVILGSSNWSKAALTQNNETNAIIRSKSFAADLVAELNKIKVQDVPVISGKKVILSQDFLTQEKLLGQMVTEPDERAFDVYLYLLKEFDGNKDSKITLNFKTLAESLGIETMGNEAYRRQIIKVLNKLETKYELIGFEPQGQNKDATITLKDPSDPKENYTLPQVNYFEIPVTYWDYHWNRTLLFPAKVMFLLNLAHTSVSSPSWYMSRELISKIHHISGTFVTDGTRELKKQNLLSIEYGPIDRNNYHERPANTYTPKPLYDPEELKKELVRLEHKYGKEKLDRAVQVSSVVFQENNIQTIQAFIDLEDQYGKDIVEKAAQKIAQQKADNPKRTVGYLINTIKSMGRNNNDK